MTQVITDKVLGEPILLYFLGEMNILSSDYGLIFLSLKFKVDKGQPQAVFGVSGKT